MSYFSARVWSVPYFKLSIIYKIISESMPQLHLQCEKRGVHCFFCNCCTRIWYMIENFIYNTIIKRWVFAPRLVAPCTVQTKNAKIKCLYTATDIVSQFETLPFIKPCMVLLKFNFSLLFSLSYCDAPTTKYVAPSTKADQTWNTNHDNVLWYHKATSVTLIFFLIK